jgi:hypothetical protein
LKIITNAFNDLENKVNSHGKKHIQIVPWTNESNWIQLVKDKGCYSFLGLIRIGGQNLSLGTGCVNSGVIQHEILHALGFYHEQSRPDRDDYVIVNFTNIISGMEYNFDKYTTNVDNFDLPYDYDSIMHYGAFFFSKNKLPTLIPKNKNATIGNREKMSDYDIQGVRLHYPSQDSISSTTKITTSTNSIVTTTRITSERGTNNTTNAFRTTNLPRRQKNKIKGSLKITVDLEKFDNNHQYKKYLTSLLKAVSLKVYNL